MPQLRPKKMTIKPKGMPAIKFSLHLISTSIDRTRKDHQNCIQRYTGFAKGTLQFATEIQCTNLARPFVIWVIRMWWSEDQAKDETGASINSW